MNSLPIPLGTVVRLVSPRPDTKVPATTDPDTGRTRPAHTDPYPWNVCVVSGAFDLGEKGVEAILTPLSGHGEPLVIPPDALTKAGFEYDTEATKAHAAAIAAAGQPAPVGGPAPPWETAAEDIAEVTT